MGHRLQNDLLTLDIDLPEENYQQSRFDWTGKITQATYKGISLLGSELGKESTADHGRGLYNEFGFKQPLGFDEIAEGEWFHKIGVGLLQKDTPQYEFLKPLAIRPARFEVIAEATQLTITCRADSCNGYAYVLKKTIALVENGWVIGYLLHNTGEKTIITNEYTHNFLSIRGTATDSSLQLSFPFDIKPDTFDETINPENLVDIRSRDIRFLGQPSVPFFFSYMGGPDPVPAQWTLENKKLGVGLSEKGDFSTNNICLWGAGHVISPELFINIRLPPRQSTHWTREYGVFEL